MKLRRFIRQFRVPAHLIEGGVGKVHHHGTELFVHRIDSCDPVQVLRGDFKSRLQREFGIAHENAGGHAPQHGRQKAKRAGAEGEGPDIALQREVLDAIHLGELAPAERLIIRIGVGQWRPAGGDLDCGGDDCELQRNGQVDRLGGKRDLALPRLKTASRHGDGVGARSGAVEVEATL